MPRFAFRYDISLQAIVFIQLDFVSLKYLFDNFDLSNIQILLRLLPENKYKYISFKPEFSIPPEI